jgi:hypothetical protein
MLIGTTTYCTEDGRDMRDLDNGVSADYAQRTSRTQHHCWAIWRCDNGSTDDVRAFFDGRSMPLSAVPT